MFNIKEIISVTLILFSVIDVIGSLPVLIDLRKKVGKIESEQATVISGILMVSFLFVGERILNLFGVDVASFAIAGALIIFLIGLEMILGRTIFKSEVSSGGATHIVPIAFPLIAGAGTLTTIISLRAEYQTVNIIVGIVINLILIYAVLKSSEWLETRLGPGGLDVLRKIFGIILLAISIKLFKTNLIAGF
ncbi:multiple antibiotic resistance protein [Spirosoma lacussanchae]|uniref:MarC family protein n=1 Tax=Spirosoma lacussanchae TaxID=1884249 RepID=UPI00110A04EB|nr:MarC family protein [Spirosoma lacussanchae]